MKRQRKIGILFGNRLRLLRVRAGLTQETVSLRSKIPRNSVSEIENGKINVSLETILRLAKALRLTMAELMPDYPTPH